MKKWFNELPATWKAVVVIVGLIVAWQLYKGAKNVFRNLNNAVETGAESTTLQAQGQKHSYSDYQYKMLADQLFSAMDGVGTDEVSVGYVFQQMNNDLDVLSLNQKFGKRAGTSWYALSTEYTMSQWLRDDLSASAIEKYVNAPLRAKGIKYQF